MNTKRSPFVLAAAWILLLLTCYAGLQTWLSTFGLDILGGYPSVAFEIANTLLLVIPTLMIIFAIPIAWMAHHTSKVEKIFAAAFLIALNACVYPLFYGRVSFLTQTGMVFVMASIMTIDFVMTATSLRPSQR